MRRWIVLLLAPLAGWGCEMEFEGGPASSVMERAMQALDRDIPASWSVEWAKGGDRARKLLNFEDLPVEGAPLPVARAFLKRHASLLGIAPDLRGLRALPDREMLGTHHIPFQQTLDGVDIEGAAVRVHISPTGHVQMINNTTLGDPEARATGRQVLGPHQALEEVLVVFPSPSTLGEAELVYHPLGDELRLSYRVHVSTQAPPGAYLIYIDAQNGQALDLVDQFFTASGAGQVHEQNRLEQSAYTEVTLEDLDDNKSVLEGRYGRVYNGFDIQGMNPWTGVFVGAITGQQASSTERQYFYNHDDTHFEEVMIYYYVTSQQRIMADLGLTGFGDLFITAYAHVDSSYMMDNAMFVSGENSLYFSSYTGWGGTGRDFAEDADVILHELGHGFVFQIGGLFSQPYPEWMAIHEGFADFYAAVRFDDPEVGEYAAGNAGGIRSVDNDVRYGTTSNEAHEFGMVWGGALWKVYEAKGRSRDGAFRLAGTALAYMDPQNSMADGADAFLLAEQTINGCADWDAVGQAFVAHSIISSVPSRPGGCTPPPDAGPPQEDLARDIPPPDWEHITTDRQLPMDRPVGQDWPVEPQDLAGVRIDLAPAYPDMIPLPDRVPALPGSTSGTLCWPCTANEECGGGYDICMPFPGGLGTYCTMDCSGGRPCPDGYDCFSLLDDHKQVVGSQCMPLGLSCRGMEGRCRYSEDCLIGAFCQSGLCEGDVSVRVDVGWPQFDVPWPPQGDLLAAQDGPHQEDATDSPDGVEGDAWSYSTYSGGCGCQMAGP